MIGTLLASKLFKIEKFEDTKTAASPPPAPPKIIQPIEVHKTISNHDAEKMVKKGAAWFFGILVAVFLVEAVCGVLAIYLSWTSNTLIGWSSLPKGMFAFFAFFFGLQYVITHLINKLDLIKHIRKGQTAQAMPSPAAAYGGASRASHNRR